MLRVDGSDSDSKSDSDSGGGDRHRYDRRSSIGPRHTLRQLAVAVLVVATAVVVVDPIAVAVADVWRAPGVSVNNIVLVSALTTNNNNNNVVNNNRRRDRRGRTGASAGIASSIRIPAGARAASLDDDDNNDFDHGGRYVLLFEDYQKVRGPYFFALFDQMIEQTETLTSSTSTTARVANRRVAFCTTRKDLEQRITDVDVDATVDIDVATVSAAAAAALPLLEDLRSSLELETIPELFVMDDWNPWLLEQRFGDSSNASDGDDNDSDDDNDNRMPTIFWLHGTYNAFHTRHLLRTSGFDRLLREQCAHDRDATPSHNDDCRLFIGEGTGAACAGVTMEAARVVRGDDPSKSPELQAFGLQLLGDDVASTASAKMVGATTTKSDNTTTTNDNNNNARAHTHAHAHNPPVCVWAQQPRERTATSFVFRPGQRGAIEGYNTERDPMLPLVENRKNEQQQQQHAQEGVVCTGEPSIDPSRAAQAGGIGDSEWWE